MQMLIHQFVSTVNTLCTTHDLILIYAKIFFHNHKLTETGHRNSFFPAKKLFSGLTLCNLHRKTHPRCKKLRKEKRRKEEKGIIEEHLTSDTIPGCHARDCYFLLIPNLSFLLRNRTTNQQMSEWQSQNKDGISQHSQRADEAIRLTVGQGDTNISLKQL